MPPPTFAAPGATLVTSPPMRHSCTVEATSQLASPAWRACTRASPRAVKVTSLPVSTAMSGVRLEKDTGVRPLEACALSVVVAPSGNQVLSGGRKSRIVWVALPIASVPVAAPCQFASLTAPVTT